MRAISHKSGNTIDMTKGSVIRCLVLFFLPVVVGSMLQQLYTTADAIIVGRFAGKESLAAIDVVYNLLKLPITFFIGLSTGASILISRYYGAGKEKEMSELIHTAVCFSIIFGVILSAAGICIAPSCLHLLSVPEDLFPLTIRYTEICFGGVFATVLFNIGAGILRAVGDSRSPVIALAVSGVLNVALDLLFIGTFHMGIAGAAVATVTAQIVSVGMIFRVLLSTKANYRVELKKIKCRKKQLREFSALGFPVAIQSAVFPIANILVQSAINQTGTASITAWALCGKMDFLIWLIADSIGVAATTFAAQNTGAGNKLRVRKGTTAGIVISCSLIIVLSIILYWKCDRLTLLFIGERERDIVPLTCAVMRCICPFYVFYAFTETISGVIKGTGKTLRPMINGLVCTCGIRLIWIFLIVPGDEQIIHVLTSYPISWVCSAVGALGIYFSPALLSSRRAARRRRSVKHW